MADGGNKTPAAKKEKKKNPHAEHRQRLKQRYLREGLTGFAPHNVLELMLFYGIPVRDTNEEGHALLDRFGGFSEVLDADYRDLLEVNGIGEHTATLLKLFADVARYYLIDQTKDIEKVDNVEALADYFVPQFIGRKEEMILMAGIDNTGKLIACKCMAKGISDKVIMPTQDIIQEAMRMKAPNVVIAHNHPNGAGIPSRPDVAATKQLHQALKTVGVRFLDHVIVGKRNDFCSMAASRYYEFD